VSGTPNLQVVDDPARACAALLLGVAAQGGQIALSGGSTPRAAYELAAQDAGAWRRATVWFSDERCVPPDDPNSNYLMARESLLDPLGDSAPTVHRIEGELGPDPAALAYETALRAAPPLDLVLAGLGPDGHTLSLFPDQPSLSERSRWVVGVAEAGHEPLIARVTLTFAALAVVKRVVFLVDGAAKAPAVAAAFGTGVEPNPHIPASMVAEFADDVTVLLDSASAAQL
jgi:6-phosphogluconolactonase